MDTCGADNVSATSYFCSIKMHINVAPNPSSHFQNLQKHPPFGGAALQEAITENTDLSQNHNTCAAQ